MQLNDPVCKQILLQKVSHRIPKFENYASPETPNPSLFARDIPTKDRRVLRGGSFNNTQNNARCAARNRNNPHNRNNNIGFRVVVSTFFSL